MTWVPVNEPLLTDEDFAPLEDAFRSGWISSAGRYVEEFEAGWSNYCGHTHGIGVANGTVALQVAVDAVGLGPGDEVIMPSYTIISCAMAVVRAGAKPVLVDCCPRTYNMAVDELEARITPQTKAIMVVHIFGHPVDMDPVLRLAERHGLYIIEDAAEVHGARYLSGRETASPGWKTCGGMGHISTFSFFANKLITTGEGGMLLTSDERLAQRCRDLRNLCFLPERRFLHRELGHQFRLTNMQAAVGVNQVKRIESIVDRKRSIAAEYSARLGDLQMLQLPIEESWARSVYWVYSLLLADDHPMDAVSFTSALKAKGIETRPFFLGMHEQPVFHDMGLFVGEHYPVTERIARKGLYIPSGLAITAEQMDLVCAAVRDVLA
jgi:perosamine synthetase